MLVPWKKSYDKRRQCIKKQRHHFANKGQYMQSYGFSSSHVWMWELDHTKGWALKNWCFWTMVLEETVESPLDIKEIKPVHPKGNQPWVFAGRSDAEAETPILRPPDAESTHWKRSWGWERLRAEGAGGNRGWDGWMASRTQWTRVWVNSRRKRRTGSELQSMGSQSAGHTWVTEEPPPQTHSRKA